MDKSAELLPELQSESTLGSPMHKNSGKVEFEWSLFWATPFFEQEFEVFYAASPQQKLCHTHCVL